MSRPFDSLVGRRFGKLIVIEFAGFVLWDRARTSAWRCRCDCGGERVIRRAPLIAGVTRTCGECFNARRRHGGFGTPEYKTWSGMRRRCNCPHDSGFKNYGGRGIKVCERWSKFENFIADMGPRPSPDHSIDRIDNNGNYEPSNCRWATLAVQNSNTRANRLITVGAETLTITQWARRVGLARNTIRNRLARGWAIEKALNSRPLLRLKKL